MNWKKVLTIGLKVIATAGAAVAVWMGFSKALGNNNGEKPKPQAECGERREMPRKSQGAQVVTNLKKFQDTCGKLFSVAQSIATVGENLYRIFNGNSGMDLGYQRQCGGFTRVSSNVIEANWTPGPSSPWGDQTKYCF